MKLLTHSGIPLWLDTDEVMALKAPLNYLGYGRKKAGQMAGLLWEFSEEKKNTLVYDVYRGIAFPEDEKMLEADRYRYDITIVLSGLIGNERKKTSGHYHGINESGKNTHPEVYEVISGTAAYVLQKSPDYSVDPQELAVDDIIIAVVKAGQSIIVPPNYGHCAINIGDGPLVFSNLAYVPCAIHYEPVQYYHGMSCSVYEESGQLTVVKNKHYPQLPKIRFATVKENPRLGIVFNKPVYQSYQEDPQRFHFLGNVDSYVDEIMSMLDIHDELLPVREGR